MSVKPGNLQSSFNTTRVINASCFTSPGKVPPILLDKQFSDFTPDITPIILAAHTNNYEVIKLLVQKGVSIPQPHEVGKLFVLNFSICSFSTHTTHRRSVTMIFSLSQTIKKMTGLLLT